MNFERLIVPGGGEALAIRLDELDPLNDIRSEFHIPKLRNIVPSHNDPEDNTESTYLCGNSLGLQPKRTRAYVDKELRRWEEEGVEAQLCGEEDWVGFDELCIRPMAKLVGAEENEVALMNSLSANLHFMLAAFYKPTPDRHRILTLSQGFPSDAMALSSHIRHRGYDPAKSLVIITPRDGEDTWREDDILTALELHGPGLALVAIEGVHYLTGQLMDMETIASKAKSVGARVGFDLAHAVGNVEIRLHDWGVDFAVWCTYKYLNSGPGGIGGCFVHNRHGTDTSIPRLSGWWGHSKDVRFLMDPSIPVQQGARGFQVSNPPILSLATLRASLEIYDRVGMKAFREKSKLLTGYLELLLNEHLAGRIHVKTPSRRGCQLTLTFETVPAKHILEQLKFRGVVCDFREPNCLRVAPNPLYNRFQDVFHFVMIVKALLDENKL